MVYRGRNIKNISFPLGGIGSGCIGLAGNGALIDWEIFNRPNKNTLNGYSHFAIRVNDGEKTLVKVLHGDTNESLMGMHDGSAQYIGFGFGPHKNSMAGFPHFKSVVFDGKFPTAHLCFSEEGFPVVARLRAFNPFIPHDEDNSGLPAAFFEWEIENLLDRDIQCAIAFNVGNPAKRSVNQQVERDEYKGICFKNADQAEDEIGYFDLCALTDHDDTDVQEYWYRGGWQDSCTVYWKNFSQAQRMPRRTYEDAGKYDHGSLVSHVSVPALGKQRIRFVLTWNVPNQYNYWSPYQDETGKDVTWKNYYATMFSNSEASAIYAMRSFEALYEKTVAFSDALWSCTLPEAALDAISSNLSVLKTPTVLRLEDGSLWGWEGCHETEGSCEGSCQHVWNYAYALPFLFPRLERSLRENTIKYALTESGSTEFRVPLPLGRELSGFRACVDGQMGEVIKCYREWKLSGDSRWLKEHSDQIFRMLEYAWSDQNPDRWDADRDGVLEGRQHHTLDMELFGPASWLEGFYLLALDCAAQMADAVEAPERAKEYRLLYEKGKKWTNEHLFNGRYFCQQIDLKDKTVIDRFDAQKYWNDEAQEIKYQIADGCIIDQMLADWHAVLIGCNGVFDTDKKQIALKNLYANNFKESMREVTNMWRSFAVNDESGTVICSYPQSVRIPTIPIPYCEECMTGFEYALAGLMIANGYVCEGERMVEAVRGRFDGEKRNPWNEFEAGSNYARSMASYALMPIYSGFSFDMRKGCIGFSPVSKEKGRYLWSVGNTWGTVEISDRKQLLRVCGEPLHLSSYTAEHAERVTEVRVDGLPIEFCKSENGVTFAADITQTMELLF